MDIPFVIAMLLAFITAVVFIRTVAEVWMRHLRVRERQYEVQAAGIAAFGADDGSVTEKLEQRLRVLERIATDRGHLIADEIEALRDMRAVSASAGSTVQKEHA